MSEDPEIRFPVKYDVHRNVYAQRLYDLDGDMICGEDGVPLNVFRREMRELLEDGKIRVVHNIRTGYRYFITSLEQENRFLREREHGSLMPQSTYHIYADEDYEVE